MMDGLFINYNIHDVQMCMWVGQSLRAMYYLPAT